MSGGGGRSHSTRPRTGSTRSVIIDESGDGTGIKPGGTSPCLAIDEEIRLQSPVPEVVRDLKVGDILALKTTDGGAPVRALTASGLVAGSIVPSSLSSFIECIGRGFSYVATVISIKGGMCIVRIESKL